MIWDLFTVEKEGNSAHGGPLFLPTFFFLKLKASAHRAESRHSVAHVQDHDRDAPATWFGCAKLRVSNSSACSCSLPWNQWQIQCGAGPIAMYMYVFVFFPKRAKPMRAENEKNRKKHAQALITFWWRRPQVCSGPCNSFSESHTTSCGYAYCYGQMHAATQSAFSYLLMFSYQYVPQYSLGQWNWLADVIDQTGSAPHFLLRSRYCTAKNFRQRKISSKATVRQFVRNLFSSNVERSFCLRSFGSLAYRLSSHSWLFLIPHLSFWGKFSQEFNLVKKLIWRKRQN